MSIEKQLREMIQDEVQRAIAPLVGVIEELQQSGDLVSKLSSLLGGNGRAGKPVKLLGRLPSTTGRKAGRPRSASRDCAIIGCRRPVRSKGYCAAHYQKQRMLERTKRLPSDWKDNAPPHSVEDIVLPRGRAGARALAEARKK